MIADVRFSHVLAVTCMIGLAACVPQTEMDATRTSSTGYERISTESEFQSRLAGRQLAMPNGDLLVYGADRTWVISRDDGEVASGSWEWSGSRWCREGQSRAGPVPRDCQIIEMSNDNVRITRSDGTGGTLVLLN